MLDSGMKLHVTGITESTKRYRFLWGFYVRGFKPWRHCQPCFRGTRAEGISPMMEDGVVQLDRKSDFFYLCGFAGGPKVERGKLNLHLAVRAKLGSTASVVSAYGPLFTIEGAEEIQIPETCERVAGRGEFDYRCMNLRFARQMYPTEVVGHEAPHEVILLSRTDG